MTDRLMTTGAHGDVATLTGAHTRRGQVKNLIQNGVRHTINAAGWPVVMWSAIDGSAKASAAKATGWTSNALKVA